MALLTERHDVVRSAGPAVLNLEDVMPLPKLDAVATAPAWPRLIPALMRTTKAAAPLSLRCCGLFSDADRGIFSQQRQTIRASRVARPEREQNGATAKFHFQQQVKRLPLFPRNAFRRLLRKNIVQRMRTRVMSALPRVGSSRRGRERVAVSMPANPLWPLDCSPGLNRGPSCKSPRDASISCMAVCWQSASPLGWMD